MGDIRKRKYILASGSPRRQELMAGLDLDFSVELCGECDESYPESMDIYKIPEFISNAKSDAFRRRLNDDEVLITADTMVLCDGMALGKPKDRKDAVTMLELLSGKKHKVLTGVTLRDNFRRHSFTTSTEVTFSALERNDIEYYVDRYRPFDKAGAYAIQEWIGFIGIKSIEGSYFNVVGLPVQRLYEELKSF